MFVWLKWPIYKEDIKFESQINFQYENVFESFVCIIIEFTDSKSWPLRSASWSCLRLWRLKSLSLLASSRDQFWFGWSAFKWSSYLLISCKYWATSNRVTSWLKFWRNLCWEPSRFLHLSNPRCQQFCSRDDLKIQFDISCSGEQLDSTR